MAIIKAVSSHAPIGVAIDYVERKEKTETGLLTGIGITPESAKNEMQSTKELYKKTGGRTYKHFVQSFAPGEKITPEEAHELAKHFAEKCDCFKDFEVLIATHKDREHIHTHFIVNSVSYTDGHKFQMSAKDLQNMKDLSDDICKEYGLSVVEKGKSFSGEPRTGIVAWTKEKYQYLQKIIDEKNSKSYIRDTATAVREAMSIAKSKEGFIRELNERGYSVDWDDKHKHITFMNSSGQKVRDSNLYKSFNLNVGKKELEERFSRNESISVKDQISEGIKHATESYYIIAEYKKAKSEVDSKIKERKNQIEVCIDKYNTALKAIKDTKEEISRLTVEKEKCSTFHIIKKQEIQERINQSKDFIENVKKDCEGFLKSYGFETASELKRYTNDYQAAERTSEKLESLISKEQESYNKSISLITDIKGKNKDLELKLSFADRESLICELKEKLGERYSEKALEKSEKEVQNAMNGQLNQKTLEELGANLEEKRIEKSMSISGISR